MTFLPSPSDVEAILNELGFRDLDSFMESILGGFISEIPGGDLPSMDQPSLIRYMEGLSERNRVYRPEKVYAGWGVEPAFVYPATRYLVSRGEFLTSYTPYQPEMSQGMLQALYEYQSVMAELLGLEVVNSSMYDGASALAEAILLAYRVVGHPRVLLPRTLPPHLSRVVDTYLYGAGLEIISYDDPTINSDSLSMIESLLKDGVSALVIEFPSSLGYLYEDVNKLADLVHSYGALFIVYTDLWSTPIVAPPGDIGADVAVAEGQPMGLYMGAGGPLLGVFAVRGEHRLIRSMPGRLIGETRTMDGDRAYTMILQTREQHIRRANATSNICTNEALSAVQVLVNILIMGRGGLVNKSLEMMELAHRLADMLERHGGSQPSSSPFHRRFTMAFEGVDLNRLYDRLRGMDYLPGNVSDYGLSMNINFFHTVEAIEEFASSVGVVIEDVQTG